MDTPSLPALCPTKLPGIRIMLNSSSRSLFALLAVVAFGLAESATAQAAPSSARKPNILFISIDDQNDWIGCLGGHPQVKTPHIDRLAQRGTLFANAHCQAPLCNPSRTSLLTGLRPSTTGIYALAPWFRTVDKFKDHVTLPQFLAQQGYRNYTTGKIYHGGYGRTKQDQEFHVLGPPSGVGVKPAKKLVETPSANALVDWGTFPHRDEDKGDWKVASWAVEQLNTKPQEPFFLSVGFFLPHVPCYVTQPWMDLYPEDSLILPPVLPNDRDDTPRFSWYLHWKLPEPRLKFLQESHQWKNLVRSYLASVSFMDSQVGRVLDALKQNGMDDNTIVILWSDHGWHLGEKLITGKNALWERSTRVPLIFAGPGISKGARCTQPVELLDIYPTLVEICQAPVREELEGHSLLPQLTDAAAQRTWPAITTHNHDNHGIRTEHWRYIQYADGSKELYDLRTDPNEWHNLASEPKYAEVIREHARWIPRTNVKPAPGSSSRILTYENGKVTWEGEAVGPEDPIPEQ
jgi:choline-sulfatase